MLLIGSKATSFWHPEHKPKNPKDWTVWRFYDPNQKEVLIRVNGWYQSYEGADYNDWDEVTPKEKMIIVYEKV